MGSPSLVNAAAILILLLFSAGLLLFGLLIFTQLGLMAKTLITPAGKYFKLASLSVCLLSGLVIAYIAFATQHR